MYERYFGLTAKPFQLNPDPDFFFGSKGHKRALAYLEYGLHQGEGFVVITGDVGAGKTTLLRGLLRQIPGDSVVPVQIVSTQVDSDDLLRLLASAFGLPAEGADKATLLVRLQRHFESLHEDGRRALLIVDEAQNLSPRAVEELRMLSNFQVGTRSLVQSFLVGQPEFRAIMQRPEMRQLKQRVIASYHLGPLDPQEAQQYIEHRLRHVGWTGNPRFEPRAFALIPRITGGVPRTINLLCDRLLLAAYLGDSHVISEGDVQTIAGEMALELGLGPNDGASNGGKPNPDVLNARDPHYAATRAAPDEPQVVGDRLTRLEERLAAVETSNAMLVNLVKRLLRMLSHGGRTHASILAPIDEREGH